MVAVNRLDPETILGPGVVFSPSWESLSQGAGLVGGAGQVAKLCEELHNPPASESESPQLGGSRRDARSRFPTNFLQKRTHPRAPAGGAATVLTANPFIFGAALTQFTFLYGPS